MPPVTFMHFYVSVSISVFASFSVCVRSSEWLQIPLAHSAILATLSCRLIRLSVSGIHVYVHFWVWVWVWVRHICRCLCLVWVWFGFGSGSWSRCRLSFLDSSTSRERSFRCASLSPSEPRLLSTSTSSRFFFQKCIFFLLNFFLYFPTCAFTYIDKDETQRYCQTRFLHCTSSMSGSPQMYPVIHTCPYTPVHTYIPIHTCMTTYTYTYMPIHAHMPEHTIIHTIYTILTQTRTRTQAQAHTKT